MQYQIYTDGACSGNPGKGGWSAVIVYLDVINFQISGGVKNTTNNRMELMAPIMALKKIITLSKNKKNSLEEISDVTIYTDSKYVKDGITVWIKKWKLNNWKNSSKKTVKNKDLWIKLDSLCQKNKVIWKWVKGHSTNKYNNLADQLAVLETK